MSAAQNDRSDNLRYGLAILVGVVWGVIALSTLVTQDYTALGATTPVMMIVVGFLFGSRREKERIERDDNDHHKKNLADW